MRIDEQFREWFEKADRAQIMCYFLLKELLRVLDCHCGGRKPERLLSLSEQAALIRLMLLQATVPVCILTNCTVSKARKKALSSSAIDILLSLPILLVHIIKHQGHCTGLVCLPWETPVKNQ